VDNIYHIALVYMVNQAEVNGQATHSRQVFLLYLIEQPSAQTIRAHSASWIEIFAHKCRIVSTIIERRRKHDTKVVKRRMAPPVEAFPAWQLPSRVHFTPDGKRRKQPVNLSDCQLKEMIQYACELKGTPSNPRSKVVCEPIVRLFRR